MRRNYKTVSVREDGDGVRILLDHRVLQTPAKAELVLPCAALAEAVAGEWAAQGSKIEPRSMPLMQLVATAIDRVIPLREMVISEIVRYGGSDLLCYRAEAPSDLVALESERWQPLLDWFQVRFDIALRVTAGIVAVPQAETLPVRLRRICEAYDPMRLMALQAATSALGSVVLGLALLEGRIDADGAFELSQLDELYQVRLWGEDDEAAKQREGLREDLRVIARFLKLLS